MKVAVQEVDKETRDNNVSALSDEIIDLLEGKTDKVIKELEKEMEKASQKLDFEQAAYIRDKIMAYEVTKEV